MTGDPDLVIGVLLADVLGTYSDTGNAVVLAQRARWRGIGARVLSIHADDTPPSSCDIYLIGGGEDAAQEYAVDWLASHRDLLAAMSATALTFAVCAGLQILGTSLTGPGGHRRAGLGLLDLTTVPGARRAVGELVSTCELPGVGLLTGFENHRGVTTLGADTRPLGQVLTGVGNGAGGRDAVEGARSDTVIATYMHGPVLARNPALADLLLQQVTGRTFASADTPDVPDLPAMREAYLAEIAMTPAGPRARRRARPWRRR